MGDALRSPPLARTPAGLFAYFRQRFAQVTNPPIDPLRESVGDVAAGAHGQARLFPDRASEPRPGAPGWTIRSYLTRRWAALRNTPGFSCVTLNTVWPAGDGPDGLRAGLDRLCADAERAARNGARLLVLSDRAADREQVPIPIAAGPRRRPPPLDGWRPAHATRAGGRNRRRVGHPPLCHPDRIRLRSDLSLARTAIGQRDLLRHRSRTG